MENKITQPLLQQRLKKFGGDPMNDRKFHLIGIILSIICVILSVTALILSLL
ncbi:hypothetical protein J5TS1_20610 [Bacillus licheniformis]|nr:hypothetical protein B34_03971 [Bacillus licheniformis]GIN46753.1 hypothetical protein J25TS1_00070 [Bacillus paralicheniformis]GIN65645.1 hypothetical protein J41TS2_10660 [Bacillus sonorensis]GIN78110.1 hypothetical protein J41TS8_31510 [Bacillus sp. J41TS8]GBC66769.1 hypothetical protein BLHB2_25900 [Bacillus licheniformis]